MLKKLSSLIFLLLLLCCGPLVRAQDNLPGEVIFRAGTEEELRWETYGHGADEFHVRLPESPTVFQTYRKIKDLAARERARIYGAYEDGVVYLIVVYDKPRQGEKLDYFINDFKRRFLSSWETKFTDKVTHNTTSGEHYSLTRDGVRGAARFYAKPKHAYMALAVGAGAENPSVEKFLNSFTMWDFSVDRMKTPLQLPAEMG